MKHLFATLLIATAAGTAAAATPPTQGCPSPAAGAKVLCVNGGGATGSQNAYFGLPSTSGFGGGVLYQYSSANPGVGFSYEGAASPAAHQALLENKPSLFNGNVNETGYAVHFGASESFVNSSSALWSYVGPNNPLKGGGGQFLQIPMWVTTDAIIVRNANNTANGVFVLNDDDLCGIFSGKLTNWNQTSVKKTAVAGTIKVYWRADNPGAGASFHLTQHLAAVCTKDNTLPGVTFALTSKFASRFPGVSTPPTDGKTAWSIPVAKDGSFSNFVAVTGSSGEADGVNNDASVSAIGYVTPDYTAIAASPAVSKAKRPYTQNFVAALVNRNNKKAYLPTLDNLQLALANWGNAGVAKPPLTAQASAIQTNWAPTIADPTLGYPIINFSLLLTAQCYSDPNVAKVIVSIVSNTVSGVYNNAIRASGFLPATVGWGDAINKQLISNASGFNLNINNPTVCGKVTNKR